MDTENDLWLPPLSTKDRGTLNHRRRKKVSRGFIRGVGFAEKTLWEWLELLGVLGVPIALAFGTIIFSRQQSLDSITISERQHQTDIQIATAQQQESSLQIYLDRMTDLLLTNNLGESRLGQDVREVARVRTLTVLPRLDPSRKRIVLRFLYEAKLIAAGSRIVDLGGADLSGADLRDIEFSAADLSFANLSGANLNGADLSGDHLQGADLSRADLRGAHLDGASLIAANLTSANLNSAELTSVDLSLATMDEADLRGVALNFARLIGSTITPKQLAQALLLQGTILPDGSTHP